MADLSSDGILPCDIDRLNIYVRGAVMNLAPSFKKRGGSLSKAVALLELKGHCIEFKYYADGIHSGLTPPG